VLQTDFSAINIPNFPEVDESKIPDMVLKSLMTIILNLMLHSIVNKTLFISTPRATGDHIICNAIYRHFANNYETCIFPVKRTAFYNVSSMLSDLKNIEYIVWPDFTTRMSTRVAAYLCDKLNFDVIRLANDGKNFPSVKKITWDQNIYEQVSLDFNLRWDGFFAPRNWGREEKIFKLLECDAGDYAFVHEDPKRNFVVDRSFIDSRLRIIKPDTSLKNFSIFDYRKVLENATQIHCMESSFSALIESMKLHKPLFAHRYARPEVLKDPWFAYQYRLDWHVIENKS